MHTTNSIKYNSVVCIDHYMLTLGWASHVPFKYIKTAQTDVEQIWKLYIKKVRVQYKKDSYLKGAVQEHSSW